MTELGLLFNIDDKGVITFNIDELKNMVTEYVYLPDNKIVTNKFLLSVVEELDEVIQGNKTLKEVVTYIYEVNGYDYAEIIVDAAIVPLSSDDYEKLYSDIEREVNEEKGSQLFSGSGLADLNLDDIYNNICVSGDTEDDMLGGLLDIESLVKGQHDSGLKLEVYKFVETELYLGYLA